MSVSFSPCLVNLECNILGSGTALLQFSQKSARRRKTRLHNQNLPSSRLRTSAQRRRQNPRPHNKKRPSLTVQPSASIENGLAWMWRLAPNTLVDDRKSSDNVDFKQECADVDTWPADHGHVHNDVACQFSFRVHSARKRRGKTKVRPTCARKLLPMWRHMERFGLVRPPKFQCSAPLARTPPRGRER